MFNFIKFSLWYLYGHIFNIKLTGKAIEKTVESKHWES